MLMGCYQGPLFAQSKDANHVFQKRQQGRETMRATATTDSAKDAVRRIIHYPRRQRYTIVTSTTDSLLQRVANATSANWPLVLGTTVLAASVAALYAYMRPGRR